MIQSKQTCQIHYSHLAVDSKLREITEVTLKTLHENKEIREKLGGENHHYEQCYAIPHELNRKYFVHPEYYRKVIFAQTIIKRKSSEETHASKKIKSNLNEQNNLFPDICMICKKHTIKFSGKKQLPKNIVKFESAEQIKKAAEKRNDEQMLMNSVSMSYKMFFRGCYVFCFKRKLFNK